MKTKFLVINQNQQNKKKGRIQRRDCKIQRGIVKYYTAKCVGRARQGFKRKKCIVSGFFHAYLRLINLKVFISLFFVSSLAHELNIALDNSGFNVERKEARKKVML